MSLNRNEVQTLSRMDLQTCSTDDPTAILYVLTVQTIWRENAIVIFIVVS